MKKYFLILGMLITLLVCSACTKQPIEGREKADLGSIYESTVGNLEYVNQAGGTPTDQGLSKEDVMMYDSGAASWKTAVDQMGGCTGYSSYEVYKIKNGKETQIDFLLEGANYPGHLVLTLDQNMLPIKIEASADLPFSQVMKNAVDTMKNNVDMLPRAGLNSLIGIGTTFSVLIIISLIISSFKFIAIIENKNKRKESEKFVKESAVDNTIAQIIEKEELSDDAELLAVITAAIVEYENAQNTQGNSPWSHLSADDFAVRSIKRVSTSKWKNA